MALPGNVYLSLQGIGFTSGYTQSFDVLCGDNPPKPVSSANWTPMKRPLQRALTIFQDHSPAQMQVEMRFGQWAAGGGWQKDDVSGQKNEDAIGVLEWMAGANFQEGPSPVLYVWSHSTTGGDTNLIPRQYRNLPWVISGGIQWGTVTRNPNGYRIRADATITLLHYLNLSAPPPPDARISGSYFVSKPGRDTALLIASAPSSRSPLSDHRTLAGRILADAHNNPCKGTTVKLQGKSISWQIRHGIPVYVPQHQNL